MNKGLDDERQALMNFHYVGSFKKNGAIHKVRQQRKLVGNEMRIIKRFFKTGLEKRII